MNIRLSCVSSRFPTKKLHELQMYMELIKDQSSKKLKGESMSTYQDDSFDLIIGEVD